MKCVMVLALGVLVGGSLHAGVLDGLMFHYDFEELVELEGGLVVPDRSGYGFDAMVGGSKAFSLDAGVFGNGGYFLDESGPVYLDLPAGIPHEEIPTDAMTIAAWVKHAPMVSEHMEMFMAMSANPTKQVCHFELRTGDKARFLLRTPIDPAEDLFNIQDLGSVPAEEWVHCAGTYDRNESVGRLYINGQIVGELPATREMFNNWDTGARVGYTMDNARPFYGLMDDVAYWRRALSEEEIAELMEKGIVYPSADFMFRRGDVNADGQVNIADAISVLSYLFGGGGTTLVCADAADGNDDGQLNIADAVAILQYLFGGAGDLPAPGPKDCGADGVDDQLPDCDYPAAKCAA